MIENHALHGEKVQLLVVGTGFFFSEKPICLMHLFYFLNHCHHCVKQYAFDCEISELAGKTSTIFIR